MKGFAKRLMTVMLAVVLAFSFALITATNDGYAESNSVTFVKYSKNIKLMKYPEWYSNTYCIYREKGFTNVNKITFSCSKKGIVDGFEEIENGKNILFRVMKAGKTVLTIKVKKKDGSIKKYKINITVENFKSPIESLKIGKKNYTKELGNKRELHIKYKGKSGKVSITPKKGWKVSKIYYDRRYQGDKDGIHNVYKKYKNNKVINFKNNKDYLEILTFTMTEKSTGFEVYYDLRFDH